MAILSADSDFHKRHQQIVAICDTGLRVVHLPPKWANSLRHLQASHVLLWWPRIEATLKQSNPRQCWRVPWAFSEAGGLTLVKVDYEDSRRRVKKAQRRAAKQLEGR
jgi:hypothetical protein